MSPTQRCLALLKKEGWECGVVERWIAQARKRIDFLGCIDLIAVKDEFTIGVQTTSGSNVSAHIKKCLIEPRLRVWLEAGHNFQIWGWRKVGARGKRKLYKLRRVTIALSGPRDTLPGFLEQEELEVIFYDA